MNKSSLPAILHFSCGLQYLISSIFKTQNLIELFHCLVIEEPAQLPSPTPAILTIS